ncbi:thioredoxin family protein [Texcoconibacillus texcoconensis]|uniref:Thioredoxin-like fold domain-containing protein n=1 Tax=Texcoconibacillus texcoconensis TaxID=1095777 RepID=A0A840QSP3_9BACI|nr:thioredoxin family protein [Texcoconibacillus texcoconensis]MBB5174370.1 hypothetical protein [Texcoconibacillus texcoconensis]
MHLKVFTSSDINCKVFEKNIQEVVNELHNTISIEWITDVNNFHLHGIFFTPTLLIDDQLVSNGKILTKEEIKSHLERFSHVL